MTCEHGIDKATCGYCSPPKFITVRSRSAGDMGKSPGFWVSEFKTGDIEEARRKAREIYARGWTEVEITVDWRES